MYFRIFLFQQKKKIINFFIDQDIIKNKKNLTSKVTSITILFENMFYQIHYVI